MSYEFELTEKQSDVLELIQDNGGKVILFNDTLRCFVLDKKNVTDLEVSFKVINSLEFLELIRWARTVSFEYGKSQEVYRLVNYKRFKDE